jgi:uncharacterized protein (TIGR01569 family)
LNYYDNCTWPTLFFVFYRYLSDTPALVSFYSIKTMIIACAVMLRPASSARKMVIQKEELKHVLHIWKLKWKKKKKKTSILACSWWLLSWHASAVGAAGGVAYLALRGNTQTNWFKICSIYGNFCRHMGTYKHLSVTNCFDYPCSACSFICIYILYIREAIDRWQNMPNLYPLNVLVTVNDYGEVSCWSNGIWTCIVEKKVCCVI